jgi:hypothetical protein
MYAAIEIGPVVCPVPGKLACHIAVIRIFHGRTLIASANIFANGVDHSFFTKSETHRREPNFGARHRRQVLVNCVIDRLAPWFIFVRVASWPAARNTTVRERCEGINYRYAEACRRIDWIKSLVSIPV